MRFPVVLLPNVESTYVAFAPDLPELEPTKGNLEEVIYLLREKIVDYFSWVVEQGGGIPQPLSINAHLAKGVQSDCLWAHVEIDIPTPGSIASDKVELLAERLESITRELPKWFAINRLEVLDRLISTILASYRGLPSPDPIEGIDTGLDFIGLLLSVGSDHGLYEASMRGLDQEIYQAVKKLDEDEQIVLLAHFCDHELDSLRDCDVSEWADVLVRQCYDSWYLRLRQMILSRIEP